MKKKVRRAQKNLVGKQCLAKVVCKLLAWRKTLNPQTMGSCDTIGDRIIAKGVAAGKMKNLGRFNKRNGILGLQKYV